MSSKAKIGKKQTQPKPEPASIKVGQTDFLKEFRNKKVSGNKITHPFAKYNASGQLQCVICSLQIPNEKAWPVHVQTRKHKDTMSTMKIAATRTSHREPGPKDVVSSNPPKILKSILKGTHSVPATPPPDVNTSNDVVTSPHVYPTRTPTDIPVEEEYSSSKKTAESVSEDKKGEGKMSEVLPEGFFDDPKRDAKMRGVNPEETMEKEWESFQKLIENENEQSELIVAQQDQIDQLERDFSETHQQNGFYTRAEELRKQQETIFNSERKVAVTLPARGGLSRVEVSNNEDSNSDSEPELDWRAQTYKL